MNGNPFSTLPENEQMEADELRSLLYALHTTPVIDQLGISSIAKRTVEDWVLCKEMRKLGSFLDEITITRKKVFFKSGKSPKRSNQIST